MVDAGDCITMSESKNISLHFDKFDHKIEDFNSWFERFECFLDCNTIDEAKKNKYLIANLNSESYATLKKLCVPKKPVDLTFQEISELLTVHFSPVSLPDAAKFNLRRRFQNADEPFNDYLVSLKELILNCGFNSQARIDEELKDQIIQGIRDKSLQAQLLSNKNLSLQDIINRVRAAESANKTIKNVTSTLVPSSSDGTIHKINEKIVKKFQKNGAGSSYGNSYGNGKNYNSSRNSNSGNVNTIVCYRCGKRNHKAPDCRFKDRNCNKCGKVGHVSNVCGKSRNDLLKNNSYNSSATNNLHNSNASNVKNNSSTVKNLSAEMQIVDISHISVKNVAIENVPKKYMINLLINDKCIRFEADCGAPLTLISKSEAKNFNLLSEMQPYNLSLTSYTHDEVRIIGTISVNVKFNENVHHLKLYVVDGSYESILGRDWLEALDIDVRKFYAKNSSKSINKLDSSHELKREIEQLADSFSDIFEEKIGLIPDVEAEIHLKPGAKPIFCRARTVPYALRAAVEAEIDRLVAAGIYTPTSTSEWATPVVPIVKSNGNIRLVGDYSVTVNKEIIPEEYPIPNIEDILVDFSDCELFSKFDLREAYMHMKVTESAAKILTVNTIKGLFHVNRLNYGLQCAPAKWQKFIEMVCNLIAGAKGFYDDIKISSKTAKEHILRIKKFFEICRKYNLHLNRKKCDLLTDRLEYLGYLVDKSGVHKTSGKIDAILKAPRPTNALEVKSFSGLVGYYGRFIPNLSQIFAPLNSLQKKDARFVWTEDCEKAFNEIKREIASDRVLCHFDPKKKLVLASDASKDAIGAVLSHIDESGEKPIAFISRTLTPTEKRYSQIDKESLAIYWSIRKFFNYLYGRKFTLITDCRPLKSIFAAHNAKPSLSATRLLHYAIFLQGFNYDIEFRKSEDHSNADFVSRFPVCQANVNQLDTPSYLHESTIVKLPLKTKLIAEETAKDPEMHHLYRQLAGEVKCTLKDRELSMYELHDGCIFRNSRIYVPPKLRNVVLKELHSGHFGVVKCKQLARSYVYWPNLDRDIEQIISECISCRDNSRDPKRVVSHKWEKPKNVWERLHFDIGFHANTNLLIIVDAFSKWLEVYTLTSISTDKIIECFRDVFSRFGFPNVVVSDNAPQFVASKMTDYFDSIGVRHVTSPPYHPASNGQAERYVQTVKNGLKNDSSSDNLKIRIQNFLLAYRRAPNLSTGKSPYELMFGRKIHSNLDIKKPYECNVEKFSEINDSTNRHFKIGDFIQYRIYLNKSVKWAYGTVKNQLGRVVYLIEDNGKIVKRHVNQMRKCKRLISNNYSSNSTIVNENLFNFEFCEPVSRECNKSIITPENVTRESKIVNRNSTRENRESNIENRNSNCENRESNVVNRNASRALDVVRESSTDICNPVRRSSRERKPPDFYTP